MSEKSLDIFYTELVKPIFHNVAFYIPSALFPTKHFESIKSQLPPLFLDEISILDVHYGIGAFEITEFNERLIKKPKLFEHNIFQLLKIQSELSPFEFEYILHKYFDTIEFYTALVDWLSVNLCIYNKDGIDVTTIGLFEIQNEIYKTHFSELINCFYNTDEIVLKQYYDISEIVKIYLPDLVSTIDLYNIKLPNDSIVELQNKEVKELEKNNSKEKKQPKLKNKIKKEPLITDQEASRFLLSTVFNINLE